MYEEEVYTLDSLGEPMFTSRSSQIYIWRGNTLLKLFKAGVSLDLILNEEINTTEAYEQGVSKVKCHGRISVGDRTGLVIEKVDGKTLISLAGVKPGTVFGVPKLMAQLQINLHNTCTSAIRSYKGMVMSALDSEPLSFLTDREKRTTIEKLNALPDGDSILHLDYHPDNIMSDAKNATIIDWMTAASGAPAADVAATLYLLTEGEMIPGLNKAVASILESIRRMICKGYLKEYKKATGMTDAEIAPWRLPFLIVRLGIWNIESEVRDLQQKIRTELKNQ